MGSWWLCAMTGDGAAGMVPTRSVIFGCREAAGCSCDGGAGFASGAGAGVGVDAAAAAAAAVSAAVLRFLRCGGGALGSLGARVRGARLGFSFCSPFASAAGSFFLRGAFLGAAVVGAEVVLLNLAADVGALLGGGAAPPRTWIVEPIPLESAALVPDGASGDPGGVDRSGEEEALAPFIATRDKPRAGGKCKNTYSKGPRSQTSSATATTTLHATTGRMRAGRHRRMAKSGYTAAAGPPQLGFRGWLMDAADLRPYSMEDVEKRRRTRRDVKEEATRRARRHIMGGDGVRCDTDMRLKPRGPEKPERPFGLPACAGTRCFVAVGRPDIACGAAAAHCQVPSWPLALRASAHAHRVAIWHLQLQDARVLGSESFSAFVGRAWPSICLFLISGATVAVARVASAFHMQEARSPGSRRVVRLKYLIL